MPRLHVALTLNDIDETALTNKIVIIVDTLFGSTSIVSALGSGAKAVVPFADEAAKSVESESFIFAESFSALPEAAMLIPQSALDQANNKTVFYKATLLHAALQKLTKASTIYAGALLNGPALVNTIAKGGREPDILIVCAGLANNFNLEDFFCTGYLIDLFGTSLGPGIEFSDAALGARYLYRGGRPVESLLTSKVGRAFIENEMEEAVRYAAQRDKFEVVPKFDKKNFSFGL